MGDVGEGLPYFVDEPPRQFGTRLTLTGMVGSGPCGGGAEGLPYFVEEAPPSRQGQFGTRQAQTGMVGSGPSGVGGEGLPYFVEEAPPSRQGFSLAPFSIFGAQSLGVSPAVAPTNIRMMAADGIPPPQFPPPEMPLAGTCPALRLPWRRIVLILMFKAPRRAAGPIP